MFSSRMIIKRSTPNNNACWSNIRNPKHVGSMIAATIKFAKEHKIGGIDFKNFERFSTGSTLEYKEEYHSVGFLS